MALYGRPPLGNVSFVRNYQICLATKSNLPEYVKIKNCTTSCFANQEEGCKLCLEDCPQDFCVVMDLKDFSLKCMDYPVAKHLTDLLGDHYPERLGVALIINAPVIFSACWAIMKPW